MTERLVKWIGADGGHKVGHVARHQDGTMREVKAISNDKWHCLVRHAHTGQLEFVPESALQPYAMRSEWEGT
jgi:hypothetical protein